jgi:copper chaperone NosL
MTVVATKIVDAVIGPRLSADEIHRHAGRYMLPSLCFVLAHAALIVSLFFPYWTMTLEAPQYPQGLHVNAYLNRLEGDVDEIDELNHYIGMRKLGDAAKFEKAVAIGVTIALALLVQAAIVVHSRWAAVLVLPAVGFPAFFLLDLHLWMSHFGTHLDPHAALSNSIKPFVPPVLGTGIIGQFKTVAAAGPGLQLAALAAALVVIGLFFHRRAYKPLVDAEVL